MNGFCVLCGGALFCIFHIVIKQCIGIEPENMNFIIVSQNVRKKIPQKFLIPIPLFDVVIVICLNKSLNYLLLIYFKFSK